MSAPIDHASAEVSPAERPRRGMALLAVVLLVVLAVIDVITGLHFNSSIAYSSVLILCWWARDRRFIWLLAAMAIALTIGVGLYETSDTRATAHRLLSVATVVTAAITFHHLLRVRRNLEQSLETVAHRSADLEDLNQELAARDEETIRQNEALQRQTEELERQREALRIANEQLARREQTLQNLLSLSRALRADLTRGETLSRVCQTISLLFEGAAAGAAILERDGNDIAVSCHHGFGSEGAAGDRFALAESFSSIALSRGQAVHLEDVRLRPDLRIPQPRSAPPFVAVLAAPLWIEGEPAGSLEVYARQPRAWNQEQVAIIESLAAQTSISLEAARMFQRIRDDRNSLAVLLRTLPVAVAIAEDAAGKSIKGNEALAALYNVPAETNYSPFDAQLSGLRRTYHRNGQPLRPEDLPLMRALRTGEPVTDEEFQITLGDSKTITVQMSAAPFFDAAGWVKGGVGALMDITAQKQLQRELDARRREAEEASVRKTHFLAAVSHDIRTPANAISLLAELIRRTAVDPKMSSEVPELAQELHASAESLVHLVGDVLDLARFDSGKIDIQESEFPLADLLQEQHRRLAPLAREKGLELSVARPPDDLRVRADRIKLARIIDNLVGNAIKFTSAGDVRITGRRENGAIHIQVSDTGVGIDPKHQRHIFDEFFQLSNPERDRNKGTGLGLAICKRLVDAMGGQLLVDSAPNRGSVFTIVLPPSATARNS